MLIFYFDLPWPSVPECPVTVRLARRPLQPKVIQSPRIHILQKYPKIVYKYNMFDTQNQTSNYKGKESYHTKDSQDIDVLNEIIFSNN